MTLQIWSAFWQSSSPQACQDYESLHTDLPTHQKSFTNFYLLDLLPSFSLLLCKAGTHSVMATQKEHPSHRVIKRSGRRKGLQLFAGEPTVGNAPFQGLNLALSHTDQLTGFLFLSLELRERLRSLRQTATFSFSNPVPYKLVVSSTTHLLQLFVSHSP